MTHKLEGILPAETMRTLNRCIGTLKPYRVSGLEDFREIKRPNLEQRLDYVLRCLEASMAPPQKIVIGEVFIDAKITPQMRKAGVRPERQHRLLVAIAYNLGYELLPEEWARSLRIVHPDYLRE